MAIQWTEDLSTGIPEIDVQHKELFHRINLLFDACNQGRGRTEIGKTVSFLEGYAETHFETEERSMIKHYYPGYSAHKVQHGHFSVNLIGIKRRLEEEGPGVHIIILTNRMVADWLRNHIRTYDRAFGDYMRNWA